MTADHCSLRLYPCYLLSEQKISCVTWFEDAIAHYGVRTVLFDLYILVDDIDTAAQVLLEKGWEKRAGKPIIGNEVVDQAQHRLAHPTRSRVLGGIDKWKASSQSKGPPLEDVVETVLLRASDWNFNLRNWSEVRSSSDAYITDKAFFPPLASLLDGLMESFLDTDFDLRNGLRGHLACQIGYLYDYAPALQDRSFAELLKYEHRQYHFDQLSGMYSGSIPFTKHQRVIRDALRQGKYQLRDCSASRNDEDLFPGAKMARILASLPMPPVPEGDSSESEEEAWVKN